MLFSVDVEARAYKKQLFINSKRIHQLMLILLNTDYDKERKQNENKKRMKSAQMIVGNHCRWYDIG